MDTIRSKKASNTMIAITLGLLFIIGASGLYTGYITYIIRNDAEMINKLGIIRGSAQRLVVLETSGIQDDRFLAVLDARVSEFEDGGSRYFGEGSPIHAQLPQLFESWSQIQEGIKAFRNDPSEQNRQILLNSTERIWRVSNESVLLAQTVSQGKLRNYNIVFLSIFVNIALTIIVLVWLKRYVQGSLEFEANHDSLTRVLNRSRYNNVLLQETERARRYKRPLSLIMLDIDHFKKVNDTYGHAVGDVVLKGLAKTVQQSLRSSDSFARIGGEEFAIVVPETDLENAVRLGEKVRAAVAAATFDDRVKITISLGIAELNAKDDLDSLFKRADTALYKAKHQGRNRVETEDISG